jgi:hypothetical protein
VRTASTWRTIGRRALPAGMLSRRIDASAKIAGPACGDASANRLFRRFALVIDRIRLRVAGGQRLDQHAFRCSHTVD